MFARTVFAAALLAAGCFASDAEAIVRGKPVPAMALYGEPKYAPDFTHFDYANPDAPKGGTYTGTNEAFLTFDTFNAFNNVSWAPPGANVGAPAAFGVVGGQVQAPRNIQFGLKYYF